MNQADEEKEIGSLKLASQRAFAHLSFYAAEDWTFLRISDVMNEAAGCTDITEEEAQSFVQDLKGARQYSKTQLLEIRSVATQAAARFDPNWQAPISSPDIIEVEVDQAVAASANVSRLPRRTGPV